MEESVSWKANDRISRIIVRLFLVVLALLLLLAGWDHYAPLVFGNNKPLTEGGSVGLLYFHDKRIDKLKPTLTQTDDSSVSALEIETAADAIKAFFKQQQIAYALCAVHFDEAASRRILAKAAQPEDAGRCLALLCDYNVFADTGADKRGYYPNAVFILCRQPDGTWRFPQTGTEQTLLRPLVCPLQQRLFLSSSRS